MEHPHKFGFIVSSNTSVEISASEDLPPDAGDPMPVNGSGGDIVRLGDVAIGDSIVFAHAGGKWREKEDDDGEMH